MKTKDQEARPDQITIKNLMRLPYYVARGLRYHAAGRVYTPGPLYLNFQVTRRCNSRCIMCSDWKRQGDCRELTLDQIGEIVGNPLFDRVEKFALSGGEPVLRGDLIEIAETVLDSCHRIKEMLLLTNGLEPALVLERARGLLTLANRSGLNKFAVSVSLDGYGETHESIRRVPHAFQKVSETIRRLKELQRETPFYLGSVCVVQPLNVSNLVQLSEYAQELELPITFVPVWAGDLFVEDAASQEALRLTENHLRELEVLFEGQLKSRLMPANVPFWREYFSIVGGEKRKLPCFLCHHYARLDSDGMLCSCYVDSSLFYGSALDTPPDKLWYSDRARETRKRIEKLFCPRCTIYCDLAFCFNQEFFYYARFLLKERSKKLLGK